MKDRRLTYRFHNPCPAAVTADHLLGVLMEANEEKVKLAVQAAAGASEIPKQVWTEGDPAG